MDKTDHKVLLEIDSSDIFSGGDRVKQGLSFEVLLCINYRAGKNNYHRFKVQNREPFHFLEVNLYNFSFFGEKSVSKNHRSKIV